MNHIQPTAARVAVRRSPRNAVRTLVLALTVGLLVALTPASASAAPVFEVSHAAPASVQPSAHFYYSMIVRNVGDSATSGDLTFTLTLPPGVHWDGGGPGASVTGGFKDCSQSANVVTCTKTEVIDVAQIATEFQPEIGPGPRVGLTVDPGAADGEATLVAELSGGGADPLTVSKRVRIDSNPAAFGGLIDGWTLDDNGDESSQAGGRPAAFTTEIRFATTTNAGGETIPKEQVRHVAVELPPGLVGDPSVLPRCNEAQLGATGPVAAGECPPEAQVGMAEVLTETGELIRVPVYNLVPKDDEPAAFGFQILQKLIHLDLDVRTGGDYGVTANVRSIDQFFQILTTKLTLWGIPQDQAHDFERNLCGTVINGFSASALFPCPEAGALARTGFLSNPTACTAPGQGLVTRARFVSWTGSTASAEFESHDNDGDPLGPTGCELVPFQPTFSAVPTSRVADAPTGLKIKIATPQSSDPDGLATAHLKKAVVTLPEGMTVSPSAADGLSACSPGQIALDDASAPTCPDASKIGTVRIDTPLLRDPMEGSVHLATQGANPFGSLMALYIVAEGPGVVVKLPGRIDLDPVTGRLTATFDENPQLPFDVMELTLKGGARAPLVNPPSCGEHVVLAGLSSWARPGETVARSDSFTLDCAGVGGFAPSFVAGSVNPVAGAFSPFTVRFARPDRHEALGGVTVELPPGLLANVRDVPLCSDADAAAGTCGVASRVGGVVVGAGAGSAPFYIRDGDAYLTGPYKGAPYGLAVKVRAVAGPLDLGTVVVRQALHVDPDDAHVTVASDPLPTILEGIPLRLRSVRVDVDRPRFTVNPTSCAQRQVEGVVTSTAGTRANVASRFQVGDCAALPVAPRLAMRLVGKGQLRENGHPGLRARLTQGAGQANIRQARVVLPKSLALDPRNSNRAGLLCPYEKGLTADCPASSIIGRAVAVSPLLKAPLRGPVHFVQGKRRDRRTGNLIRTLPTLLVKLDGEIEINLRATSSVTRANRLVTTFGAVPDARVKSFRLSLMGGKTKGILVATGRPRLCDAAQQTRFGTRGHNGALRYTDVRIKTRCVQREPERRLNLRRPR